MIDTGGRQIPDASAGGAVATQPVLLLAAAEQRLVERTDALERAAADGHIGAPHELDIAVGFAEVERRDRRRLTAAGARAATLEARPDRTSEHVVPRGVASAVQHRLEPPSRRLDVVVDEDQELTGARGGPGVAR